MRVRRSVTDVAPRSFAARGCSHRTHRCRCRRRRRCWPVCAGFFARAKLRIHALRDVAGCIFERFRKSPRARVRALERGAACVSAHAVQHKKPKLHSWCAVRHVCVCVCGECIYSRACENSRNMPIRSSVCVFVCSVRVLATRILGTEKNHVHIPGIFAYTCTYSTLTDFAIILRLNLKIK